VFVCVRERECGCVCVCACVLQATVVESEACYS